MPIIQIESNLYRGGGQMVNVIACYSGDTSLNPAEVCSFYSVILYRRSKNKKKVGDGWLKNPPSAWNFFIQSLP